MEVVRRQKPVTITGSWELETGVFRRALPRYLVSYPWDVADDVRRLWGKLTVARSQLPELEAGNWRLGSSVGPCLVTSSATPGT